MRLTYELGEWLADQLESMPMDVLRSLAPGAENWLARIFGAQEADEVRALLTGPSRGDSGPRTVFLPGMMGSLLASVRGISGMLWFSGPVVMNGRLNLLDLSDDGAADRWPEVEIVPVGIEKTSYLKAILTLARETRLYEFPYDWRKRVETSAEQLHQALQRWSGDDPASRFTLVAHSMGGMVARAYLALHPREAEQKVERLILLASPLYGVPIAATIFAGDNPAIQIMDRLHPGNDVRRFAMSAPSCYQLLPAPSELWPSGPSYPLNWDAYDAAAWGLPGLRQDYLDAARAYHELVLRADPQVEIWQIAGCNQPTIVAARLAAEQDGGEAPPLLIPILEERGDNSGDDTVPLWSTRQRGVRTLYVEESHAGIPANSQVLETMVRLTHGEPPTLPDALPLEREGGVPAAMADLGQQVAQLRKRFEAGALTKDDILKMFFAR